MAKFKQRVDASEAVQFFAPGVDGHNPAMLAEPQREEIELSPEQKSRKQGPFFRESHRIGDVYGKPEQPGGPLALFFLLTPKGPVRVYSGDWIVSDGGVRRVVPAGQFAANFELVG